MPSETQRPSRQFKIGVWRSLMEVHAGVLAEIERALDDAHDMTVSEFDTLVNIPRAGVALRDLTDLVVLSQSALSRLVDRLARRGLVERAAVAGDSRAVHVRLTEQGRRVQREAARTNAAVVERLFAGKLSAAEMETMHSAFTRLREDMKVVAGGDG